MSMHYDTKFKVFFIEGTHKPHKLLTFSSINQNIFEKLDTEFNINKLIARKIKWEGRTALELNDGQTKIVIALKSGTSANDHDIVHLYKMVKKDIEYIKQSKFKNNPRKNPYKISTTEVALAKDAIKKILKKKLSSNYLINFSKDIIDEAIRQLKSQTLTLHNPNVLRPDFGKNKSNKTKSKTKAKILIKTTFQSV